jgi:hypothetical protein
LKVNKYEYIHIKKEVILPHPVYLQEENEYALGSQMQNIGIVKTSITGEAPNRNEYQESFWEVKCGQRIRLTVLPPSLSLPSIKCGILNILHSLLQG